MKKITLIVVDCQYDFVEGGSLEVKGGLRAVACIHELLMSGRVGRVVFTQDWHPADHCSFAGQGGPWPVHCVKNSRGARVHSSLVEAARKMNVLTLFLHKGKEADREEYTAFAFSHRYANHLGYKGASATRRTTEDVFFGLDEPVVVCGIAGDVCVLNTLKSLAPMKPRVFVEGTASLDGGSALAAYMQATGLEAFPK